MANYMAIDQLVVEPATTDTELQRQAARLSEPARGPSLPLPSDLSTWESFDDQLSYSAALKMGLPVANIDASYTRRILIRDVRQYASVVDEGVIREYGVSVRLVITVYATDLQGELTVPIVAAKAQLGLVHASARLSVLGFKSAQVGKYLPDFVTLDVGNYGKYTEAADAIKKYISNNQEHISPCLLRTVEPPSSVMERLPSAVATARALRLIEKRRPLRDALLNAREDWPEYREGIEATYEQLQPGIGVDDRPDERAVEQARRWLSLI